MESVKSALMSSPTLVSFYLEDHMTHEFDACNVPTGSVLLQMQPDNTANESSIGPVSSLKNENWHDTPQRKGPATVYAVFLLRPYLEKSGSPYVQSISSWNGLST